jgi:hypothetical protein
MKPHIKDRRDSRADRRAVRGARGGDRAAEKREIADAVFMTDPRLLVPAEGR